MGLTYYYPHTSGLSHYAKILAEELAGNGYQVEVICARHNVSLKDKELIDNVVVNRLSGIRLGKGFIMPGYWWRSISLVRRTDVVHCHLPCIESMWLAIWAKLFDRKLVVTYHCYFGNRLIEMVHNLVMLLADKIVVNSIDYIDGYELLGNVREKVVEIPPPIVLSKTEKAIEKIKDEKRKLILFLGRISREKNLEVLLKAIGKLPDDYLLVMAGPESVGGEESYKKEIDMMIGDVGGKVIRVGLISEEEKVWLIRKCHCLVLPSNDSLESYGMAAAEAISLGTPAIINNKPGMRVLAGHLGVLFDGTVVDLVNKILKLKVRSRKGKVTRSSNDHGMAKLINRYRICLT